MSVFRRGIVPLALFSALVGTGCGGESTNASASAGVAGPIGLPATGLSPQPGTPTMPTLPGVPGAPGVGAPVTPAGVGAPVAAPGVGAPATGTVPGGAPPPTTLPPANADPLTGVACEAVQPLSRQLRPLSGTEYQATIRAAFPELQDVPNPHNLSDLSSKFSNAAHIRRFDSAGSQAIVDNALAVAASVAPAQIATTPCLENAEAGCVADWIRGLGRTLYREPPTDAHVAKLALLFESAAADAGTEAAVAAVIQAQLSSAHFLFRKELGVLDAQTGTFELTPHEVASAIAYTLTNAPPDQALAADADAGVTAAEMVAAHVPRLMNSGPAGRAGMTTFIEELLVVRGFVGIPKDPEVFPMVNEEVQTELAQDFAKTVDATLSSATPTFSELIAGKNYVTSERSREFLGWQGAASPEPELVPEAARQGVLTHPVFVATYANEVMSNPVSRGHFISADILCVTIPTPPDDVSFPEVVDDGVPRTTRQILEEQHSNGGCAGCHALMDPLGFPFEVFDAVGRLRDSEEGLPIDPTGLIVGTSEIDGPVQDITDMLSRVANSSRAQTCFSQHVFSYVTGVDSKQNDFSCRVRRLSNAFQAEGGDVRKLFSNILSSPEFLVREGGQ